MIIKKVLDKLADKKLILKTSKGGRSWFHRLVPSKVSRKKIQRKETWIYKPEKGKPQKDLNINIKWEKAEGPDPSMLDFKLKELQEKRRSIDEDIQAIIRTVELLQK